MLTKANLTGIFPALPTPFDQNGKLDRPALARNLDHVFDGGAAGVVALGGTGEYTALLPEERIEVVEATVEAARGRGPVIAGVLSPGFREAAKAGRDLTQAGAAALMLVTPFYVASTQQAIREYYKAFAETVGTPTLVYEIPYKTLVSLKPETVAEIAADGSAIGLKACNLDIAQFTQLVAQASDKMAILSGEDHLLPIQLAIGAPGCIHATANLFPRIWREIYDLAIGGDLTGALAKTQLLKPMMDAVFAEGNPGPLKEAMAMIGLPCGRALRPLGPPSESTKTLLRAVIPPLAEREARMGGPVLRVAAAE